MNADRFPVERAQLEKKLLRVTLSSASPISPTSCVKSEFERDPVLHRDMEFPYIHFKHLYSQNFIYIKQKGRPAHISPFGVQKEKVRTGELK